MPHNKVYREIPGYEDALYKTNEMVDELDELNHEISYGEKSEVLLNRVAKLESMIAEIKEYIS